MNDRYRDYLRRAAGYFAVVLVSGAYVATAFIRVGKTGKTPAEILSDGALALLLGLFINRVFDLQGMMLGERDERLCATLRLHGEIVSRLSPVLHLLPGWCAEKNRENLRECRRRMLSRRGLRYEDYFEADGSRKRFALQKAPGTGCKKKKRPRKRARAGRAETNPSPALWPFPRGEAVGRGKNARTNAVCAGRFVCAPRRLPPVRSRPRAAAPRIPIPSAAPKKVMRPDAACATFSPNFSWLCFSAITGWNCWKISVGARSFSSCFRLRCFCSSGSRGCCGLTFL